MSNASATPDSDEASGVPIGIPFDGPAYLPGARLLAVLACPPTSSTDHRWRAAESVLGRLTLTAQQQLDPDWADRRQTVIPAHLLVPETVVNRHEPWIRKNLEARMGAAHTAIPLFQDAGRFRTCHPRSVRRAVTIDGLIHRVIEQEAEREDWLAGRELPRDCRFPTGIDNFDNRTLRPSLPTLHLAVAVAIAIDRSQKALAGSLPDEQIRYPSDIGGPQISFADFLARPQIVRWVVTAAEGYEKLLPGLSKLKIPPARIVRVRSDGTPVAGATAARQSVR